MGNDPIRFTDPLGLEAIFTFSDRSTKTAYTAQQFQDIAKNAGVNSIDSLVVNGHGAPDNQGFDPYDNSEHDEFKDLGFGVYLEYAKDHFSGLSLGDMLKNKFSTNGHVYLIDYRIIE